LPDFHDPESRHELEIEVEGISREERAAGALMQDSPRLTRPALHYRVVEFRMTNDLANRHRLGGSVPKSREAVPASKGHALDAGNDTRALDQLRGGDRHYPPRASWLVFLAAAGGLENEYPGLDDSDGIDQVRTLT